MASYHHGDRSARRSSSRPRSLYAAQNSPYLSNYSSSSPYLNSSNPYSNNHSYSSPYSSPTSYLSQSAYSPQSSYSSQSPYSSQSLYSPQSPYSTYGGTNSGYGGLVLPSSSSYSLSNTSKMASSPTSSYLTNLMQSSNYGSRTGSPPYSPGRTSSPNSSSYGSKQRSVASRSNSFNRHHSSPNTSLGTRSLSTLSLKSDASDGYVSGGEKSGRSSRLSSATDGEATANGEIDYKKLYEESQVENERLREKLRKTEEDLKESKVQSDKNVSPGKNSMSELEKRERRAMERKLSEMEEELKQLQKLKAENERLRAENRALTRVVSKLTASANAGK